MNLTNRRKQFLERIVQEYSKTNEPVHYSNIAKSIGVSKWTAYDVLKELEKQDFLERTYTVNPNETGRSIVVYVPTDKSKELFELQRPTLTSSIDWEQLKDDVLTFIRETSEYENPLKPLLEKLTKVELKLELCAYFLGILLVHLNKQGDTIRQLTINLVNVSNKPITQVSTFVGAVIGMIIESASEEISPEMVKIVQQFMKTLEELEHGELVYLVDFLTENGK